MKTDQMKNAVEAILSAQGLAVEVEAGASPVEGSPNGAIWIWLSEEKAEGPHVLVTDGDDVGESGFLVGAYFEDGEQIDEPRGAPTYTGAASIAARLVSELSGMTG